jgi:hypothetical protein
VVLISFYDLGAQKNKEKSIQCGINYLQRRRIASILVCKISCNISWYRHACFEANPSINLKISLYLIACTDLNPQIWNDYNACRCANVHFKTPLQIPLSRKGHTASQLLSIVYGAVQFGMYNKVSAVVWELFPLHLQTEDKKPLARFGYRSKCHIIRWYVVRFHVTWHQVIFCDVMSGSVMSCHVVWRHVTWCNVMSRGVTSCHVVWRHLTCCNAISSDLALGHVKWRHITRCDVRWHITWFEVLPSGL